MALVLAAGLAGAADAPALDAPLKNPTAKRIREKAKKLWESGQAVHTRTKSADEKAPRPTPDELRKARDDIVEAIELFESAQLKEWDLATNTLQAQAVRLWAELNGLIPEAVPPTDPEVLEKWKASQAKDVVRRKLDARRMLGKLLSARRYSKQFQRCSRCDGRGEFKDRFGGQPGAKAATRTCGTCDGHKLTANRKRILAAHWFCYSPNYRADGRNRSDMSYVLRLGVRGTNKIAPYIMSTRIGSDVEDHGWWLALRVKEKVQEEPTDRKGAERETEYVLMRIGKIWWLHSERFDTRTLLRLPDPAEEGDKSAG